MFNRSHRLVVKHHDPRWYWLGIVVLLLLVIIGGWSLFDYGRGRAGHDFEGLQQQVEELRQQVKALLAHNKQLSEQKAILERRHQVDQQANSEVKKSLGGLQDEILELKKEVAFYRSIVSPSESSKGLRIQTFNLASSGNSYTYRYKLVLTQVMKKNRGFTSGQIDIQIEGIQDGKASVLSLADLTDGEASRLKFKFKYFQDFQADVRLPDGFEPLRVKLQVSGKNIKINKLYAWSDILSSGSL
jgi:hypothetical protein